MIMHRPAASGITWSKCLCLDEYARQGQVAGGIPIYSFSMGGSAKLNIIMVQQIFLCGISQPMSYKARLIARGPGNIIICMSGNLSLTVYAPITKKKQFVRF